MYKNRHANVRAKEFVPSCCWSGPVADDNELTAAALPAACTSTCAEARVAAGLAVAAGAGALPALLASRVVLG